MHPLVTVAMRGGELDTEKLRELMALQREWEQGEARKSYTQAMVELKKKLPAVLTRDCKADFRSKKTGQQVRYSFASLAHAMDEITPHLNEFGFSVSWIPKTKGGMVHVVCRITHVDGHYEEAEMSAPPDTSGSKNPIQAIGATQSYLERYTSRSLLGIATADMPDADQPENDQDVIDINKNIEAFGYLVSIGISRDEAESHVKADVNNWTSEDLTKLRALAKQKKSQQADKEPQQPTQLEKLVDEVSMLAKQLYGEDDHMNRLAIMCRSASGGGFAVQTMTREQAMWARTELSDRLAAIDQEGDE